MKIFFASLLALGLLWTAAPAQAAPPKSAQDMADVARIEEYLNGIGTMKSEFVQVTPDGATQGGQFYLRRPGRLRFEYTKPKGNFVVADGYFIYLWDNNLKTQSQAPIGSTLASFILRDNIRLSGDVRVTDIARAPGSIAVTLGLVKDPGVGQITLAFLDRPLELKQWVVIDAQGLATQVSLVNPQQGIALDSRLFQFNEPGGDQPKYN